MTNEFTHLDAAGHARMVDVGEKSPTRRVAVASAVVHTRPDVVHAIERHAVSKGDVLAVARVAGIMAAKQTSALIPLCHPLPLEQVELSFQLGAGTVSIECRAAISGKTGVEMEALTGAAVAALTIYDMCKSMDRSMRIDHVQLEAKSGGKSGDFVRKEEA